MNRSVLLEVKQLRKHYRLSRGKRLKAVDGVTLQIHKGETFGLVGESGCGKSTVGRMIIRLEKATKGEIFFQNQSIRGLKGDALRRYRRQVQMIFQDPYASLNPRMQVADIISEGLEIHQLATNREKRDRVEELLELVGLKAEDAGRFPHEFSGGQRQRIGIARALAVEPDFIIADEPTSALDVSVQAQIINLMKRLQKEKALTYLFISHDLSMVKYMSDRIGVMYLGKLVEQADRDELFQQPLHPYTQALLSAVPIPDPKANKERERIVLQGEVPSPIHPPSGCAFRTRCPHAMKICSQIVPAWKEVHPRHWVACHLYREE